MPNLRHFEETIRALEPNSRELDNFHACGIYLRGKIISLATNTTKTHPITKKYAYHSGANIHAELRAIMKLGERDDYHKLVLVSARIDLRNNLANSKPCVGCSDVINQIGFRKIIFTNGLGKWEEVDSDAIVSIARPLKKYRS